MPIMQEGAFGGGSVSEADIKNANFSHVCEHCDRSFSTHQGLVTHTSRWCGEAERESFPNDYQVDYNQSTTARKNAIRRDTALARRIRG